MASSKMGEASSGGGDSFSDLEKVESTMEKPVDSNSPNGASSAQQTEGKTQRANWMDSGVTCAHQHDPRLPAVGSEDKPVATAGAQDIQTSCVKKMKIEHVDVNDPLSSLDERKEQSMEHEEMQTVTGDEVRFLIIGKTGTGKSTVGNILLGEETFHVGQGMCSTTETASVASKQNIKVIDTPDIETVDNNKIDEEMALWTKYSFPEPSAILLTVRCDVRYSLEEFTKYEQLKKLWGDPSSFCKRLVVAFTFGDRQKVDIEEELRTTVPQELKNVLKDAGDRYVVFDNTASPEEKQKSVRKLLSIVENPNQSDPMETTESENTKTEKPHYRLLLIGKTGNGKSTLGNVLLAREVFADGCGMFSTTTKSEVGASLAHFEVMDTPDISAKETTEEKRQKELSAWKNFVSTTPHSIVLVIRCDVRYTAEEYAIYRQIKDMWGDASSFCQRLVVAFTFGDRQKYDMQEELETTAPEELKNVLKDAENRYVVFSATASREEKKKAVDKLFMIIESSSQIGSTPKKPGPKNGASGPGGTELCLLIVGKTGNGKSSVGNSILGEEVFETGCGMFSTTTEAQCAQRRPENMPTLKVIDTSDISDSQYTKDERTAEVLKWMQLSSPGPHAILLAVRCDVRYTPEEHAIYRQLKGLWDRDPSVFYNRLIVAFTFGDRQKCDIDEELRTTVSQELKNVLKEADHRYVVFDNTASAAEKQKTVTQLLANVEKLTPEKKSRIPKPLATAVLKVRERVMETDMNRAGRVDVADNDDTYRSVYSLCNVQ